MGIRESAYCRINQNKVRYKMSEVKAYNEKAKLESGTVLVATYGSLRRNMENFTVNQRAGGEFLVAGKSTTPIALYQYGGGYFPSISLNPDHAVEGTPEVVVDIFTTTQAGLEGPYDTLEGHSTSNPERSFYNRTEVEFETLEDCELDGEKVPAGTVLTAWVYHIDEVQPVQVQSGDWCVHKRGEEYYKSL